MCLPEKDSRRSLILETALHLFTVRGYFSTSVHDIRREADVSIGSIYHHFKGKEAIARALYDGLVGTMAQAMEEIAAAHGSAHDRCRAVVAHLYELTERCPEAMQFILYARHREFLPGEKPICSSRPFELMKEMVAAGIETGEIRVMAPVVAATSLFGGAIRMIYLRLDGALPGPLPDHLEETWQCAWRSVAAE
ncbi:MAG: TetR/AcrR family transcriptional regulator [Desulfobacteraceae bacterium]|nr:TetR/AcrR family transcriptional regulator [Desulfobacteraceae bacterium]